MQALFTPKTPISVHNKTFVNHFLGTVSERLTKLGANCMLRRYHKAVSMTYSSYSRHERYIRAQDQFERAQVPKPRRKTALMAGVAVIILGSIAASAQVSSPFASKKKKQAWETTPTAPTAPYSQHNNPRVAVPPSYQHQAPQLTSGGYSQPSTTSYQAATSNQTYSGAASGRSFSQPNYNSQPPHSESSYKAQNMPPAAAYNAASSQAQKGYYNPPAYQNSTQSAPQYHNYSAPQQAPAQNPDSNGHYYPGRPKTVQNYGGYDAQNPSYAGAYSGQQAGANPSSYGRQAYGPQSNTQLQRPKASWKDKIGLSNLATTLSGFLKLGAAATDADTLNDDGWREDFIADGMLRGEVSAITQGGLEYGVGAEVRGQYDKYRRGFGGRVGDCPAGQPGCASQDVSGFSRPVRGHTSQFYTDGPDDSKEASLAIEGAYLFLRSAYGDITLGRDDGAAYLFSLGAPTLVAVNASNSPVDYTGIDSVKTVNDASGFAEKITYISPRLLGDQIGLGVQFGASYSLDAKACGVDYCVNNDRNLTSGTLAPDLEDVLEFGLSLDRKFNNGLTVEATATYATASEQSGQTALDDLQAFGAGLDLALKGWRLGGSYLQSNNALQNGDYTAYDVGLSWKPAQWGVSVSYGHAEDDNAQLKSDQATLGFAYDLSERFTLGTGLQYVERSVPTLSTANGASVIARGKEKAASIFVEGGVKF